MKTPAIIGILLIILGVVAFAYQGFTYTTTEKAIDLGPIQVTAEKEHTFPLPPVVGAIAIVGGLFLLFTSGRKA
jgi:membrane-bound ClpP family serine protease